MKLNEIEKNVQHFTNEAGLPVATHPFMDRKRRAELINFLESELRELQVAHEKDDAADFLDAIIDSTYYGAQYVVEVYPVGAFTGAWDLVHKANMTKVEGQGLPLRRPDDGKIMKPEGFMSPNLAEFCPAQQEMKLEGVKNVRQG